MPFTIKKIAMRLRNDSEYIPLPGVRGEAGPGVPAGGTTGQVLAKTSSTDYATRWVDAGGSASMTILSYGHSTWADFIAAYNSRSIVYCRASSGSDPASGSQTRLAFMAYVNSAASPTSVEFQYYSSVSSHTDSQQGDQVYVYKLTSAGTWSVETRNTFTKIAAGTNMTSSYANGTLTLNATGGGTADALPLAGGTMEGDIDMDGNAVTGLPTPNANSDAVPKSYADTKYSKPSGGIPQTDLAQTVQSKLDNTVVVSDTQPTATENKLWVDTDAGAGSTYQVPTVAEMEAADAQIAAEIGKNKLNSIVDLLTYSSSTNAYTFPSDGYVFLSNNGEAVGRGIFAGSDTTKSFYLQIGNAPGRWSMYVKAGMRAYCEATPNTFRFIPLT